MRNKYLLGATVDGNLVFGEVEITTRNGYKEFTASFDEVRPFNGNDFDATAYVEMYVDDMDKKWKYDQCEHYNCAPQDLVNEMSAEINDPRDIVDCSLYNEEVEVNGDTWYFESESCGQHDTRGTMEIYTNKEAYNRIHKFWDEYHLKEINVEVEMEINSACKLLEAVDEEAWIENYIAEHMY